MLIMSLVHGVPLNPDLGIPYNVEFELSQKALTKLFRKKSKLAFDLHAFLSRDPNGLLEVCKDSSLFSTNKIYDQNVLIIKERIMNMLYSNFNFDQECIDWLKSLTLLILGDHSMIEFISKIYLLSPTSMDLLAAVVTHRIEEMEPLFYAIYKHSYSSIETSTSKTCAYLLHSDIGGALLCLSPKSRNSDNFRSKFSKFTKIFTMMVSPTHISKKTIINNLDFKNPEDYAKLKHKTDIDLSRKYILVMKLIKHNLSTHYFMDVVKKLLWDWGYNDLVKFVDVFEDCFIIVYPFIGALNGELFVFGII